MTNRRRNYTKEFKLEAVRMLNEGRSAISIGESLGVSSTSLYRWRKELEESGDIAAPGRVQEASTDPEKEIQRLRKELEQVKQDRDILKKAAAYFAKHQG